MNPHIFVYGSLIRTSLHAMAERLRNEATFIDTGTIQGRLYRVSWYPAMAETDDPASRVHGEIFRMRDPDHALVWLDAYEGITRDAARGIDPPEYERTIRRVRMDTHGAAQDCWVYLYQWPIGACERITSGRWLA